MEDSVPLSNVWVTAGPAHCHTVDGGGGGGEEEEGGASSDHGPAGGGQVMNRALVETAPLHLSSAAPENTPGRRSCLFDSTPRLAPPRTPTRAAGRPITGRGVHACGGGLWCPPRGPTWREAVLCQLH